MKKLFLLISLMMTSFAVTNAAEKLTLLNYSAPFYAKNVRGVDPIPNSDQYARISDDGKQILTYSFKTNEKTGVLFDVNNTTNESISDFDGYIIAPDGKHLLIQTETESIYRRSFRAQYYIYTIQTHRLERLSDGDKQQIPVFSDDGYQIAFVREGNIFLVKLLYDNAETQVTKDGEFNHIINGAPDWVYEEEFEYNSALCFNADATKICWVRWDEGDVESYTLQMFKGMAPEFMSCSDYPGAYSYKYPKAGHDNSKVSAWSYDIKSRRIQQLQVPVDADGYIPRIFPTSDPNRVLVYTMNRHQDQFCIYGVNPASTLATLIVKEEVKKYVKEDVLSQTRIGNSTILMPSDRDGYTKLYLYTMNGQLQRTIGDGNYDITDVYGYDEVTGDIYYQSAQLGPQDRQVYVARKNGKVERLTDKEGWNTALFSGDYKYFVNTWSDMNTPYVVTVRDNKGKVLSTTLDNHELCATLQANGWNRREMFSFTTSEGIQLNGWMLKPADFNPGKKYPVIMHQYSGPGSQQVRNAFNIGSNGQGFDYLLAQEGYIVVCVDGRGTGGRGADFEKCTYMKLGDLESKDQVETALWLGQQSYVDKNHIGIWGWSYGGFNTLMSMSEGRAVFCCGVAIAPPTNWKYYDSVYTERYMRTPQENPTGYGTNPIQRAMQLSGALLICHGLADDNVHPQNTFEYSEALVQADKDFKELIYTNRNHSIYGGNTRNHLMRQVVNWFNDHMK